MIIFNFVNLKKKIHIKLYILLILNEIQKKYKKMLKHRKRRNQFYFQGVYFHVNKLVYIKQHIRPRVLTISDCMIKITI